MSHELPRAPLVQPHVWLGEEDVNVAITPPIGRRISMTVSETALNQMGAHVVRAAVERLGQELPHLYAHEIQQAVDRLLFDEAFVRPIVEEELRKAARAFVMSLWSDEGRA